MKIRIVLIIALLAGLRSHAQSKWMFENYNYIKQPGASFVPMLHFQTNNNWYGELRYNYEGNQTLSLLGGRTFSGGKSLSYTLTPMVGISAGEFSGVTLATNIDAEFNKFYIAAQSQFSKATRDSSADFFFNWSELGYSFTDHLYGGIAMQYTHESGIRSFEPGLLAGLSFNNVSIPFYAFSPLSESRYFVLGLNVEFNFGKKKNK